MDSNIIRTTLMLIVWAFSNFVHAGKQVIIYNDEGADREALAQTEHFFSALGYKTEFISAEKLLHSNWHPETGILVIPGGADIPYTKKLNGLGNKRIRAFVEAGGTYVGICAGAYFASERISFAEGTTIEVSGQRELAFYPGEIRGPVFAAYQYESYEGSRAIQTEWLDGSDVFHTYYNGGGYFVSVEQFNDIQVLAYGIHEDQRIPIIIERAVGKGKVVLSAVHFEYDPFRMDPSKPHLAPIIARLKQQNTTRLQVLQSYFKDIT